MVRVRNIDLSPVMCREKPLSRYQDFCFSLPFRHTCNIDNVWLRYPYFCGSSWVSSRYFEFTLCSVSEIVLLCLLPDFRFRIFSLRMWLSTDSFLPLKSRLLTFRLCFLQNLFIADLFRICNSGAFDSELFMNFVSWFSGFDLVITFELEASGSEQEAVLTFSEQGIVVCWRA